MKLEVTNANYSISVVRVKNIKKIEGLDNLVGVNLFGYNILSQKDIKEGELKLLITTETQLSPSFLANNNLYRHKELNLDRNIGGYLEDSGRVRAIKFRGCVSNALLLPLSSLSYLNIDTKELKEGDSFNSISGVEIAKKYYLPEKGTNGASNKTKGLNKRFERLDGKQLPEHFDTENYFKNEYKYDGEDRIIVTQKLHGTSVRLANIRVTNKPSFWNKLFKQSTDSYDYIAGSRRVIKDLKSSTQFNHYYETNGSKDIWNKALDYIGNIIPKDTIFYGEIIGWNGSSPIQSGYTYNCIPGEFEVYVYRIVSINRDNQVFDWSWEAIKQFCVDNGTKFVPEIYIGKKKDFVVEDYLDKNYYHDLILDNIVPLDKGIVDEGVCIRREGITPYITKAKSPLFFEYETKLLDKGEVNLEDNQI